MTKRLVGRIVEDRPLDVKPSKVVWMIATQPPPMPDCWPSLRMWQEWLMLAHTSGMRLTRRQDTGKYAARRTVIDVFVTIDHCIDCSSHHRDAMEKEHRCSPSHAERERDASREAASQPPIPEVLASPTGAHDGNEDIDEEAC